MNWNQKRCFFLALVLLIFSSLASATVYANGLRNRTTLPGDHQSLMNTEAELLAGLSEDERLWYQRFQEGVLLFDGWTSITTDLLEIFPEEQLADQQAFMQQLGMKIGIEWAKDNDRRKIDSDMLEAWGDRIRTAKNQGSERTLAILRAIEQEVDVILERKESLAATSR